MGRKIDRTLLGLELIGALIFIISIVNYIISELSRRGYIRDITVVYIGTIIFLLILFYGYVFARIKNEDYYLKHKASIKTFIWGILLTIGVMSLSVFFLLFGLGQYGSFLTILSFVLFVIIPIIMFAIENPQFAGCEHNLLKRFCPAGKCFIAELMDKLQNPYLFKLYGN